MRPLWPQVVRLVAFGRASRNWLVFPAFLGLRLVILQPARKLVPEAADALAEATPHLWEATRAEEQKEDENEED